MRTLNALNKGDHDKIIPTARAVAYFRSFSEVPYAREASEALGGEAAARQMYQDDLDLMTRFSGPVFEARYKCFDRFIRTHPNIVELAMGTSVGRGLTIAEDPEKLYIGTDLPEMIDQSKIFLGTISKGKRTNHFLEAANVLSYDELNAAISHLGSRRDVAIISEGLWMYLTAAEQSVAAENVRRLLEKHGGTWVTPDIWDLESNEKFIASLGPQMSAAVPRILQKASAVTGRTLANNYFANREEAVVFFRNAGFEVAQYPMVHDLGCLTSLPKLWGEQERRMYGGGLMQMRVWALRCRGSGPA